MTAFRVSASHRKWPLMGFCDNDAVSWIVSVAQLAGAPVTTGGCGFESCRWRSSQNDRLQSGSAIGPGNGKDWALSADPALLEKDPNRDGRSAGNAQ
jgi:hypothetical protein